MLNLLDIESMSTTAVLLLKVTIVLIAAWLLQATLRRSNPRWRILIWRMSAIGLVGVAMFSLRTPVFTIPVLPPPATATAVATIQPVDVVDNRSALPLRVDQDSDESNLEIQPNYQQNTAFSDPMIAASNTPFAPPATSGSELIEPVVSSESIQNPAQISWDLSVWGLRFWLAGSLLCFVYLLIGMAYLAKVCRSSIPVPGWVESELNQQIAATPEAGKVTARQSDYINAPCSVGVIRKTILLPAEMCSADKTEQLRAVLAHELAHFSGNDLHWNYVFYWLSIVLWFHPLVWRIRRVHADACDERCDAKAASQLGDGAGYIRQLARVALQVSGQTPTSALPMARDSNVTKRIQMLQQGIGRLSLRRWKARLVAMMAVLLLLFIGAMGVSRSVAQKIEDSPPAAKQIAEDSEAVEQSKVVSPGFSGRLLGETGAPVTDATIELTGRRINDGVINHYSTKTDKEGRYLFDDIKQADTYRIRIKSQQWVGLTDWNKLPRVQLSPESSIVRDFTLQKACSIRIKAIDDAGKPISFVNIYTALLTGDSLSNQRESSRTNKQGWATIGGLKPSKVEYIFGTFGGKYGAVKLLKVLDDPSAKVEQVLVLSPGKDVSGTIMCSDGKPAAGWRISAKPTWWHFGVSPSGTKIAEDGSFTLSNITNDNYDIVVNVPIGGGLSREERVKSDFALSLQPGPLEFNLRVPSPKAMTSIAGEITTTGLKVKERISIMVQSDNGFFTSTSVMPGESSFRVQSLPPGRYTMIFSSTEVEEKRVANVKAPSDDLKVDLKVIGRPRLVGKVVHSNTNEALSQFKIRVIKLGTLRGPNYMPDSQWETIENDNGEFSVDMVGPGIYQIVASADNLADMRSERINTDEYEGEPIILSMSSGVTLTGTVVDEQGKPIDGAMVLPRSRFIAPRRFAGAGVEQREGGVKVTDGKFTLVNLPVGTETLEITHPEHCFALSSEIEIKTDDIDLKPIVMTRGGTVEGYVYDASGQTVKGATLHFQDRYGYGGDPKDGRFATAVTDQQGHYKAQHLPEKLCYVHRADEWTAQGVVRSAILPVNGKTQRLDFGGKRAVTGRLLVNGKPLSKVKIQLGGSNPSFGVYRSFAQTNTNGEFTFWGPSAGRRTLYYAAPATRRTEWIRAEEISIVSSRADLGDINIRSTDLTVSVTGLPQDLLSSARVSLNEYDPIWTFGTKVGVLESRGNPTDPFKFRRVPSGKYELVCYRQDSLAFRKVVTVDATKPQRTVEIEWPKNTGTLEVSMDDSICGPGGCNPPNLWSEDQRINGALYSQKDNKVRFENLPAGKYYLADGDTRASPSVLDFSVEPGGTKRLDLTSESYSPKPFVTGALYLKCFTEQGVPLPGCKVELSNGDNDIRKQSEQGDHQTFIGTPGTYMMSVTFPGYQAVQRQVELRKVAPDGSSTGDSEIEIRMAEAR